MPLPVANKKSEVNYMEGTTTMATFITNIVTPVSTFIMEQIPDIGELILSVTSLGMTFGIFLLGGAVSMLGKILRKS